MTKKDVYKACKKYANDYTKNHIVLPANKTVTDGWNKADFVRFRTEASRVVSQIELDLKGIAGKVSDDIFEELITSVGGEKA